MQSSKLASDATSGSTLRFGKTNKSGIVSNMLGIFALIGIFAYGLAPTAHAADAAEPGQIAELSDGVLMKDGIVYPKYSPAGQAILADAASTEDGEDENPVPEIDLDALYAVLGTGAWTSDASRYFAEHWLTMDHARISFIGTNWQYIVPPEEQAEFVSTLLPTVEQKLAAFVFTEDNMGYLSNGYHISGALGLHNSLIGGPGESFTMLQSAQYGSPIWSEINALEVSRLLDQNLAGSELDTIRWALAGPNWQNNFPAMTEEEVESLRTLAAAKVASYPVW